MEFKTDELLDWDDFINIIRGADAEPRRVAGEAYWNGRIVGPLGGPTFAGHMHVNQVRYDKLDVDEIDGDMEYSPDLFRLTNAVIRRGSSSAKLALSMGFDGDWNFLPESPWSLEANVQHISSDDLQALSQTNYPVRGFMSGELRGTGTREAPLLDSNVTFEEIETRGFHFDRLTGQLHVQSDEVRFSSAELRKDSGRIAGDVLYRPQEKDVTFDLAGSGIELSSIRELQTSTMPAAGQFEFKLRGNGPLTAPAAQGDFHLNNLSLGAEKQGNFSGQIESDGK